MTLPPSPPSKLLFDQDCSSRLSLKGCLVYSSSPLEWILEALSHCQPFWCPPEGSHSFHWSPCSLRWVQQGFLLQILLDTSELEAEVEEAESSVEEEAHLGSSSSERLQNLQQWGWAIEEGHFVTAA